MTSVDSSGVTVTPKSGLNSSLRQILFVGAGLGILIPALVLAFFQSTSQLDSEIDLRVRAPMTQYAQVLSKGLAAPIWNVDKAAAEQLIESVFLNPDVVMIAATDEYKQSFAHRERVFSETSQVLYDERDILYNGNKVGHLRIALSTVRVTQSVRVNLVKIGLALLAQVGISFALIWLLFDQRLLRPLQVLQLGAQRLARGELNQSFQWKRQDEIGSLAQDLDNMRGNISDLIADRDQKNSALQQELLARKSFEAQILQLNASLEERVEARTRELNEAMAHLRATQDELVRTEKMSALGALVAGIAHELNTPIGNSLTVASTLASQISQFSKDVSRGLTRSRLDDYIETSREGADILTRSLHHAADLVSSFKQVAVDQTSLKRRKFDLRQTIGEILATLGPGMRKAKCRAITDIDADITMESYPGPLGQVVSNLINNAMLHAFEGRDNGNINLSARLVDNNKVELVVEDDGCGIPVDHLGKIFDPFFTTKLGQGGSGLGLNIVYNLVIASLGGNIRVESTPGKGTRFILSLPLSVK
jgi:signal transduction histidine kinase